MPDFVDTFTGTAGANLNTRAADSGEAWAQTHGQTGNLIFTTTPSGDLKPANAVSTSYYPAWTPPGPDYTVEGEIRVAADWTAGQAVGVWARATVSSSYNGYYLNYQRLGSGVSTRRVSMGRFQNGGAVVLSAFDFAGLTAGESYYLRFTVSGASLSGRLVRKSDGYFLQSDGSFAASDFVIVSGTDSVFTTGGVIGVWTSGTPAPTDTTGVHFTGLKAAPTPLAAGAIIARSINLTTISLASAAAGGGYPAYTYQWQRSTTGGGVGFTDLSGATALTYDDTTVSAPTLYYYRLKVVASDGTTVYSAEASATPAPPVVAAVNDANIFWTPMNTRVVGSSYAIWTNRGAYVKLRPQATAKIVLHLDMSLVDVAGIAAGSYPMIGWHIDGGVWQTARLTNGQTELSLATGLSPSVPHDVHVELIQTDFGVDNWNGPAKPKILGFEFDPSGTLTVPSVRPNRLTGYGDSILEASYVTSAINPGGNDSRHSFLHKLARELDAEVSIIGWSGQGWSSTGTGNVPSFANAWNFFYSGQARTLAGSGTNYIYIGQGTNGSVTSTVVKNTLDAIRADAGSTPWLIVQVPWNRANMANITSGFNSHASGNPKSILITPSLLAGRGLAAATGATSRSVDGLHPDQIAQGDCAAEAAGQIATAIQAAASPSTVRGSACFW